jgi:hypothetical protein
MLLSCFLMLSWLIVWCYCVVYMCFLYFYIVVDVICYCCWFVVVVVVWCYCVVYMCFLYFYIVVNVICCGSCCRVSWCCRDWLFDVIVLFICVSCTSILFWRYLLLLLVCCSCSLVLLCYLYVFLVLLYCCWRYLLLLLVCCSCSCLVLFVIVAGLLWL